MIWDGKPKHQYQARLCFPTLTRSTSARSARDRHRPLKQACSLSVTSAPRRLCVDCRRYATPRSRKAVRAPTMTRKQIVMTDIDMNTA
jgi:hypothetical protein